MSNQFNNLKELARDTYNLLFFKNKNILLNSRKNPINGDRVVVCVIMPAGCICVFVRCV